MTSEDPRLDPHFDHVGIAVADAAAAAARWESTVGLSAGHSEVVGATRATFLGPGEAIELVAPTADEGPIARFLDERGPGLHHLALRVADVDRAIESGRIAPDSVVDGPRIGARGHRVAFQDPAVTDGVLVEFVSPE
jgi:methylmalonyl-CoA epimerase